MNAPARHLRLLTETIAAVNSTLDLQEVLGLVARKVAEALDTDACFVYLYDERADELVLRATHGTRVEEMTRRPKLRPGEGITGSAAAQRRVGELEALARICEAVSESLYREESLEAIVKATVDAVGATGAALVLEDGGIARPEGQAGAFAVRIPLRWKGRQIGELVCDRDTDFTADERALLASIAHHAAVALEHGRAVMRGVLAQEIHHRVKNNLQTVASLLRLQARAEDGVDPRKALDDSVN